MPTAVTSAYQQASLTPYKWQNRVNLEDYQVGANLVIPQGGIVAAFTGANTDDVQTLSNTATGGTFTLTVGNALTSATAALACTTLTAAQLQTALNAAYAALCPSAGTTGFVTVTGGPFTSGGGTLTVTYNNGTAKTGPLSSNPQTLMVINNGNATGGSVTIAHTTTGIANGALTNYNGTQVANPTTAPTLTATGAGGTIGAGTYAVTYTKVTAAGESLPSYAAVVTLTAAQSIQVTSITGLEASVTKVNFYINNVFALQNTPSNGATGTVTISAFASSAGKAAPTVSTAFVNSDGSQSPVGAAWYAMASAPNGAITFGASAPSGNEYRPNLYTGNTAISGYFLCANLVTAGAAGVDQNTVTQLGRLIVPGLTTGVLQIQGA
jgi:hypothetical protein